MLSRCGIGLVALLLLLPSCADTQEFTSEGRSGRPSADTHPGPSDSGVSIASCDTARDANNCGACGHRCLGGACLSGICQPIELARGETPTALAVAGDDVYFLALGPSGMSADRIRRVPTRGGPSSTAVTLPGGALGSMLLRGGFLYVAYASGPSNVATIGRLALGGDTLVDVIPKPLPGCRPAAFTVTSTSLVFTCDVGETGLFACPLTGCAAGALPLDPSFAMWRSRRGLVDVGGAVLAASEGAPELRRLSLDGVKCDVAMTGAKDQETAIAYDGTSAYVARSGELLELAPVCGAGHRKLLVKSGRLERPILALNDDDVLWGEQNLYDGSILRCAKAGCDEPEVIATGQGFVMDVVATNDAVYWVTTARVGSSPVPGTVMKLALPPRAGLPASLP